MASGQQAMQDTIGQASALTGGYANSYATSAGNQAYNAYIQDAYNNLPEYYQMALEAYNMEGQDMYNQLGMLADADATEYGRMYDAYNTSASNYQTMYNEAYGAYKDNWNNNYNMATLGNSDFWNSADNTYRYDAMENDNYWNGVDNEYRYDVMENDNYWNGLDNQYRYDAMANNNEQASLDRAQADRHQRQDILYKNNALAQDDRQFTARYDVNGDGKVDANDQKVEANNSGLSGVDEKHYTAVLDAYNQGGVQAMNKVLNSLSGKYDEEQLEGIAEYVGEYGEYVDPNDASNPVAYEEREWKLSDDGGWHIGALDDNAVITDQYGQNITIKALYKELQNEGMSAKKAKEYITALQDELGI
jgi:hypothetical protein